MLVSSTTGGVEGPARTWGQPILPTNTDGDDEPSIMFEEHAFSKITAARALAITGQ